MSEDHDPTEEQREPSETGNRILVRTWNDGEALMVRQLLETYGIPHRYEEFDDSRSGVDYRLDTSLPFLYQALTEG